MPGIDLGFGDNNKLATLNGDFHYQIATGGPWRPYLGGGVGLNFWSALSTCSGQSKTRVRDQPALSWAPCVRVATLQASNERACNSR